MRLASLHQSTEERRNLILNGPILRTLLFLSVPTLMLGFVQALMPLTDGLFINNLAGNIVASAVTYSTPIINMMSAFAQGLSVAAMAILGQLNGRGNLADSKKAASQIVVAGSILGCLSAPFLVVAAFFISGSINPEISHAVFLYLSLNALVLPFSFLESIYNGIMNANGKPEAPFIRMVIMLALKIAFNFLFLVVLRMGLVGCVLASLCANALVTVWMFYELFGRAGKDRLEIRGFRFDWPIVKELARVGFPAMLNSFFLNLGFFLINTETQKYGALVLTAQGIANNISSVCFILPGCLSSSVTMMVSMNIGAGRPDKAKGSCWTGSAVSAAIAAIVIAIVVPLSSHLTVLFTRDPSLLGIANRALHIYTYSVVGFGVCMTIQGAFIGLGRTRVPLVLGLLRIWLLRYVFILATEKALSFYSVFWGNLFSNYAAALIAIVLIARVKWVSVIKHRPATAAEASAGAGLQAEVLEAVESPCPNEA
jgi:putative MATE family efflux protein